VPGVAIECRDVPVVSWFTHSSFIECPGPSMAPGTHFYYVLLLTAHRNVSVITIVPGRELPSKRARNVEFYHVVSGQGLFSQQGVDITSSVVKGDAFVVDPGSIRWISNADGSEDLVLLRATDGGLVYSNPNYDVIRRDPNRRVTAMEVLKDSFRQAQGVAKSYAKGNGTVNK